MYFFAVIFIVIALLIINYVAKQDPIEKDKISHTRKFSKHLCEPGEVFYIQTEIKNETSRTVRRLYVRQVLDGDFELKDEGYKNSTAGDKKRHIIGKTFVPPNGTQSINTAVYVKDRGVYKMYKIGLESLDLLGFHSSIYEKEDVAQIVIAPRRVNNAFINNIIMEGYGDFNAKKGFIFDEASVRSYGEYTGHEPMRHINWKKTAQMNEFVVKQFEPMGAHVTAVVLDVSGYTSASKGGVDYKYLEYSISMLRELLEYFESKHVAYSLYTNAVSPLIKNNIFKSAAKGSRSRENMLMMLGQMQTVLRNRDSLTQSDELLNYAIKGTSGAPLIYLAPKKKFVINSQIKKLGKIKGIEIVELYARDYYREEDGN